MKKYTVLFELFGESREQDYEIKSYPKRLPGWDFRKVLELFEKDFAFSSLMEGIKINGIVSVEWLGSEPPF